MLSAAVLPLLIPAASSAGLLDILDPVLNPPTVAPVPEPSGALIMGAALLVLAAARRQRK
jgi:hypothetical protein